MCVTVAVGCAFEYWSNEKKKREKVGFVFPVNEGPFLHKPSVTLRLFPLASRHSRRAKHTRR